MHFGSSSSARNENASFARAPSFVSHLALSHTISYSLCRFCRGVRGGRFFPALPRHRHQLNAIDSIGSGWDSSRIVTVEVAAVPNTPKCSYVCVLQCVMHSAISICHDRFFPLMMPFFLASVPCLWHLSTLNNSCLNVTKALLHLCATDLSARALHTSPLRSKMRGASII